MSYVIVDSLCKFIKSCKPNFSNQVSSCYSINQTPSPSEEYYNNDLWLNVRKQAHLDIQQEPILFNFYYSSILSHNSLENALAHNLAVKLSNANLSIDVLCEVFASVFGSDLEVKNAIRYDLRAVFERDPACTSYVHCFLHFKGFLACQAHRVAHKFWKQGRTVMALLIQSRISEVFAVDIHLGAKIGHGIVLDHATGIVIGETTVVGDNVTILHNVTLGGTGKVSGDRHPKIGDGVLIGAGAKILGNAEMQRLRDKLAILERTAKTEAQLKEKLKLRLGTLEEGLKTASNITLLHSSPMAIKSHNILNFLTSSGGVLKKRSTSQPRGSAIGTISPLQQPNGENISKRTNKLIESNGKENTEMKTNKDTCVDKCKDNAAVVPKEIKCNEERQNKGDHNPKTEDIVLGFPYDRLQKEVIALIKLCEVKDSNLNCKDEEITMLVKKVEKLMKREKREATANEKEGKPARADRNMKIRTSIFVNLVHFIDLVKNHDLAASLVVKNQPTYQEPRETEHSALSNEEAPHHFPLLSTSRLFKHVMQLKQRQAKDSSNIKTTELESWTSNFSQGTSTSTEIPNDTPTSITVFGMSLGRNLTEDKALWYLYEFRRHLRYNPEFLQISSYSPNDRAFNSEPISFISFLNFYEEIHLVFLRHSEQIFNSLKYLVSKEIKQHDNINNGIRIVDDDSAKLLRLVNCTARSMLVDNLTDFEAGCVSSVVETRINTKELYIPLDYDLNPSQTLVHTAMNGGDKETRTNGGAWWWWSLHCECLVSRQSALGGLVVHSKELETLATLRFSKEYFL
ncbi:hypothetical protein ACFE04_003391 [Oxalis oulophora]